MVNLKTKFIGLELKSPIIAGSCGLTSEVSKIEEIALSGAGAIVLKSIFEEQINIAKNKINELELTDDIRRFISRITSNNATIEDLTPNILKWIKDNKYENKIKLRFK